VPDVARARVRRRLAAILVAGYRRLLPGDEVDRLTDLRAVLTEIIQPLIIEHGGNLFKQAGDLALSDFDSVVEATRCAAGLRDAIVQRNQTLLPERHIAMRIGINLGDIILDGGDLFGDGVNIAARLEALAEPGSIYVSGIVYDQVVDKIEFEFEDLGPKSLKNIRRPIHVYRMAGASADRPDDTGAAGAVSPAGFDDRRAVAVLPFANFSDDPEQEFFADGITEDIISLLAGWRAFPVIARNSTFTYKGQTVDIKKVGQELGASYVLEGSVRKSGRRVRVTAQLIRADTNHHIMAERYDRDLIDLFELQDEIVTAIAGAIQPELLKFERERIAERPQHSADAYELYQHGMFHHYRQNKTDNIEAQAFFRRAVAIDAQYPQATAALAIALTIAGYLSWAENPEQNFEEAFEQAQRAVALDPRYPNAHFALALICTWTARSDRAVTEFQEAIKLNPSFAAAHSVLGAVLNFRGQSEEAVASVEKGIRLSPNDPRLFIWLPALAAAHYQLRHYYQAVATGRRSWTLNRHYTLGLTYVVAGLAQLGQIEEARAALTDLKELDPNLAAVRTTLQRLYQNQAGIDHLLDGLRKAGFE
jgi:TolB-like protein/class 3 adenylate cyclase/lipopolysaccharide biosynthesis regulator YciM